MGADPVRVKVMLFAWLREAAATVDLTLEVPAGSSGVEARAALARRFPVLADKLDGVRLAINEVYQPWDTALRDGDVLALIPPVSGG